VEDWRPGADRAALEGRAAMLAALRAYFAADGVLEVETPLACRATGSDPQLQAMVARYTGPGAPDGLDLYLQTSPEFAMKRLLASGCGPIYQICKAFRDGEAGRLHNPEFSVLEWYRPGFGASQLMDEVAALVRRLAGQPELTVERVSYRALFLQHFDLDPLETDAAGLRGCALERHLIGAEGMELDRDGWLDLLMVSFIEPELGRNGLTFVTDYPASQASLARLSPQDPRVAHRFELYWKGVELANGFEELVDAQEQSERFEQDNCRRFSAGQRPMPIDDALLSAMEHGLPPCSGVALGLDRVLMCQLGLQDIEEVLNFSLAHL